MPWLAQEMGQDVWRIAGCTSLSEDGSGIAEMAELLTAARDEGWENLQAQR